MKTKPCLIETPEYKKRLLDANSRLANYGMKISLQATPSSNGGAYVAVLTKGEAVLRSAQLENIENLLEYGFGYYIGTIHGETNEAFKYRRLPFYKRLLGEYE